MLPLRLPGGFVSAPDPQLRSLYARLEEVLGTEHAETLMTHLSVRDDLATKSDVAAVRSDIAALASRFDGLEGRFDGLEGRFDGLEGRFDGLEGRFERLDERIDARLDHFGDRLEHMYDLMHTQFRNYSVVMATAMTGLTAIFGIMLASFG
jgi:hypothetical protein